MAELTSVLPEEERAVRPTLVLPRPSLRILAGLADFTAFSIRLTLLGKGISTPNAVRNVFALVFSWQRKGSLVFILGAPISTLGGNL